MAEIKQKLITLVLGKVSRELAGEVFNPAVIASSPVYYKAAVPKQVIVGQENFTIGGKEVTFHLRGYQPDVLLIQTTIEVENIFHKEGIFALEKQSYEHSYRILKEYGGDTLFSEEYSVFAVTHYQGDPDQFLKHRDVIVSLLKSEILDLDPQEVQYTLGSKIKYGNNDLSIIDWDGAFLFDPAGDIEEDMELLTLANLQLLRYRVLDHQLDGRLARMAELVRNIPVSGLRLRGKEMAQKMKETMEIRMGSISELQRLERDIKLIGDWYSARFYELAAAKFKIEEWRKTIRSKLESLEDTYSLVIGNFTVSVKHRAEWAQIIAFFILQIGWFVLLVIELLRFMGR
ncbi:MAG: hypothetical protein WAK60_06710 [Sedimentisphaerales bacterium]